MNLFGWYRKTPLVILNISAFILGCIAGLILWKIGQSCNSTVCASIIAFLSPFGNILVYMLKMIVIPIVFFSLICGTSFLPLKQFGKMGLAVIIWYFATSCFASVFGTAIAFLFNPSLDSVQTLSAGMLNHANEMRTTATAGDTTILNLLYGLFRNPFQALASGDFLPVIVFAILFGLAARVVLDTNKDEKTIAGINAMLEFFDAVQKTTFQMIDWVMRYFPIGVFALASTCFASYGMKLLTSYVQVALCVITGILLMIFICYPLFIFLLCRRNPYPVLWKMREPILTAFVTHSSAATLPVSFKTASEKLHIKHELSDFALSLGATVNMDGVCIHLPVFAVLAANLFGFSLSPGQILILIVSVVFASIGAGGIPGGSIFLLFLVLDCLHLTPDQSSIIVAIALGINPLLDMFETACNVAGDNVGAYIIGRRLRRIEKTDDRNELTI